MIAVGSSLMEIDSDGEGSAPAAEETEERRRFRTETLRHPCSGPRGTQACSSSPRHPSLLQTPRHPSLLQPPRHPSLPLPKSNPKLEECSQVLRSEREHERMMWTYQT